MKKIFFWLPNFITAMNLASGCTAVFLGIEGQLAWAAVLIGLASVFDFMDGFAARLLHSYSTIGKQLDSLSDLVSFGLAPAALLMSLLQLSMFGTIRSIATINATPIQWIFLFSVLIVPVAGAFRLAKFNIDTRQTENFLGLPIPSNALFFASLALIVSIGQSAETNTLILNQFNLIAAMIIFAALMISEVPMFSMKFKNLNWETNKFRFIFLAISLLLFLWLHLFAIPLIILWYILLSVISRLIQPSV